MDSDGVADDIGQQRRAGDARARRDGSTPMSISGSVVTAVSQPGTGTPGYWKNHPEAWPVRRITIGGKLYTTAQAITWLEQRWQGQDHTMFASLVSAKLNVLYDNDASCVASTIDLADAWMAYGPVGSGVHASSLAWKIGEPLHRLMDNYNNGMLCAPHRD